MGILLALVILIVALIALLMNAWDMQIAKARKAAARAIRDEFHEREYELEQEIADTRALRTRLKRQSKRESARLDSLEAALIAKRAELEAEEKRVTGAIQRATAMTNDFPAANEHEAISAKLRELHLKSVIYGRYLTVHTVGSVEGFVRIRWSVQPTQPQPPRVDVYRDGSLISSSWAFSGEHGDQVDCGRRYLYKFHVVDAARHVLENDLALEVRIPTSAIWSVDVGALVRSWTTDVQRDARMRAAFGREVEYLRLVHELLQAAVAEVDGWNVGDEIKTWAKAQVESLGARFFEGDASRS